MGFSIEKSIVYVTIISLLARTVSSIECYQCSGTDSKNPFECNEFLDSGTNLTLSSCDNIYDAKFCIKHVGRFEAMAIECFQCDSTNMMECSDGFIIQDDIVLKPEPCDHVHNAKYCIKRSGGIGTKRFCSSLDLGNYCNYVQQPGDKLEYRTCLYTCSVDGCNSATTGLASMVAIATAAFFSSLFKFIL